MFTTSIHWFTRIAALTVLTAAGISCEQGPRPFVPPDKTAIDFESAANRPPTPATLFTLARILAIQGRDYEAGTILARIIREYPDFIGAYYEMVDLRMRHDDVDEAIRVASAGLKVRPNDGVLLNNLGICHAYKSDYNGALEAFTKAAAANPDCKTARANIGLALGMQGRYNEALSAYSQVVEPADAHYNVAVLAEARNDPAKAEAEYAIAKKLNPDIKITPRQAQKH